MSSIFTLRGIAAACALTAAVATFTVPAQALDPAEASEHSVAYTPNYTPQQRVDYCNKYATTAMYAVNESNAKKCGHTGPRWGNSYTGHFNWCMNEPNRVQTGRETRWRREAITQCNMCDKLRSSDQAFQREYDNNRCESVLPQSKRGVDGYTNSHFNACTRGLVTQTMVDNIKSAQQTALNSCKNINANQGKLGSTFLKLKKTGFSKTVAKKTLKPLASTGKRPQQPDKNIELTSAKIDSTVDDGSVVVVDTDAPEAIAAPAPKRRTQVIVIGNRYAEVPAFDEPAEEGGRAGDLVKAGAAAVVVGTAAVATGAVAAKALDYAADYKGGISKAGSGAAGALKQKLKDRLDGGGITKAASGALEAMKKKVKDRAASGGGVSKAVAGAKEALKYKLQERAASGGLVSKAASGFKEKVKSKLTGGGLMKGVAKAGGGLLRRLARR